MYNPVAADETGQVGAVAVIAPFAEPLFPGRRSVMGTGGTLAPNM